MLLHSRESSHLLHVSIKKIMFFNTYFWNLKLYKCVLLQVLDMHWMSFPPMLQNRVKEKLFWTFSNSFLIEILLRIQIFRASNLWFLVLDKFIIHVLKSFMGIFPAVHFTSDKKNSQLFTFTGITRGISASKRRTMGTVYSHKPFFMYTNT